MKKAILVFLTAGMLLLQACGNSSVTESTIEIKKDGSVLQTTIETLDETYYDGDEFESYAQEAVDAFNDAGSAEGTVTLKKCSYSESDGAVTLILSFTDAQTYTAFEQKQLFCGTVHEAKTEGYDFYISLITAEEAQAAESADASADASGDASGDASADETESIVVEDAALALGLTGEENVIILEESYHVTVPGTILYVTEDACSMVSDDTVSVDADQAELIYIIYE